MIVTRRHQDKLLSSELKSVTRRTIKAETAQMLLSFPSFGFFDSAGSYGEGWGDVPTALREREAAGALGGQTPSQDRALG